VRHAGLSNLKSHRVNRDDRLGQLVPKNGNLWEFPYERPWGMFFHRSSFRSSIDLLLYNRIKSDPSNNCQLILYTKNEIQIAEHKNGLSRYLVS
jgi:hypothetical protein